MHSPAYYALIAHIDKSFPQDTERDFVRFDLWRVNEILSNMERWLDMAQNKPTKKQSFGPEITFLSLKLSEEQASAFSAWQLTKGVDFELEIADFMAKGWKTSLTWDNDNDCYICASTCKDERNPNMDVCVTSRSDRWFEAMLLNVYKVVIIHGNKKIPTDKAANNWG